jgi:hypothetical protein
VAIKGEAVMPKCTIRNFNKPIYIDSSPELWRISFKHFIGPIIIREELKVFLNFVRGSKNNQKAEVIA